jgi:hypothetical protein
VFASHPQDGGWVGDFTHITPISRCRPALLPNSGCSLLKPQPRSLAASYHPTRKGASNAAGRTNRGMEMVHELLCISSTFLLYEV